MPPSLPPELLNHIASYASCDTLSRLCRTSHEWHTVATEPLFRHVTFKSAIDWDVDDEYELQAHELFLTTVSGRPDLGCLVMYLNLVWGSHVPATFILALKQMPNLRHLGVPRLGEACIFGEPNLEGEYSVSLDAVDTLCNLDQLDSIDWTHSHVFDMDIVFIRMRPLRAISYELYNPSAALDALVIRSASTLERLSLVESEFSNLAEQLAKAQEITVFPQLKELELRRHLDLQWLQGPHFAAVEYIVCTYLRSRRLLDDKYLLPNLRAIAYKQNYHIDTYELPDERDVPSTVPPQVATRCLRQVFINLSDVLVSREEREEPDPTPHVNKLFRATNSLRLSGVSCIALQCHDLAECRVALVFCDRLLKNGGQLSNLALRFYAGKRHMEQVADEFVSRVSSPAASFQAVKTLCLCIKQIWNDSESYGDEEAAEAAFLAEHRRIVEDVSGKVQSAVASFTVLRAAFISVSTRFAHKRFIWRPSSDGISRCESDLQGCEEAPLDPWSNRLQDVDRWLAIVDLYSKN